MLRQPTLLDLFIFFCIRTEEPGGLTVHGVAKGSENSGWTTTKWDRTGNANEHGDWVSWNNIPSFLHIYLSRIVGFPSSHVWMWELDHKDTWATKNWGFWTVVSERTLESPLGCKEINPVNSKGDQSWIFIGRTDAEAETPILWPPDAKNWLLGKDPDAGKDWRREEKGMTEDEMVGWHHRLNGHEFEQATGVGDGQGSLECCSPWGRKELDTTEWLNWTEQNSWWVGLEVPSYISDTEDTKIDTSCLHKLPIPVGKSSP